MQSFLLHFLIITHLYLCWKNLKMLSDVINLEFSISDEWSKRGQVEIWFYFAYKKKMKVSVF